MFTNEKDFISVTEKVYANLEKAGVSERTVRNTYRYCYQKIYEFLKSQSFDSYSDIYQNFITLGWSNKQLTPVRAAIRELAFFDNENQKNVSYAKQWNSKISSRISCLELQFREILNEYLTYCQLKEYAQSTISNRIYTGLSFFEGIQHNGIPKLSELDSEAILTFFNEKESHKYGYCYVRNLKYILVAPTNSAYSIEKIRILNMLPEIQFHKGNIQYLSKQEVSKIVELLQNSNEELSMMSRSIGLLALLNGLRSSDIRNLCLSNIDWNNDKISIIQKKTGVPLQLPLLPIIGNALFEYITKERSQLSRSQNVFVSDKIPYEALSRERLKQESNKIYLAASIRTGKHEKKGLHLLRHNFATKLLSMNYSVTTISKALGHKSPTTTQTYLSSGLLNLKECALDVSCFSKRGKNEK
jgi:integrase